MASFEHQDRQANNHLPVGTFPVISEVQLGPAAMRQRILELEALCAEVYEAAVIAGLSPALLNRLWMVAAHGNSPRGFTVELPTDAPLPDVPLIHRPTLANTPPLAPLAELVERKTVMLVDDDPAMLELIAKILSVENYDLMTAASGDEALSRIEAEGVIPDLLVTDLMMPGMDGRQLAGALRERAPSVGVLYQTGFTDVLFQSKQELEVGEAFLEKPFSARGLMEAARLALFGTMNPAGQPPLED
jgi:CheY-like chemotaxis protein